MNTSPKLTQGLLAGKRMSPRTMRRILNWWPPFFFARIHCEEIAEDWRSATVRMKMAWYNRNAVGTHFGGAMFAMTDPFFMLMLMQIMGPEYLVWDRHAAIDFKLPGRGTLRARFAIDEATIATIRAATADGNKYEPVLHADVVNAAGEVVLSVTKKLYIRRKPQKTGSAI
ncbi:DUF4442 domain-containing protein [Niveibacterium sp. SC-1]|uniref:DUF4442 domain-containing protein n=1 Tax=Niveibacterium sp. SC-1 TaxID=3135646 RepID=UPI00311EE76A